MFFLFLIFSLLLPCKYQELKVKVLLTNNQNYLSFKEKQQILIRHWDNERLTEEIEAVFFTFEYLPGTDPSVKVIKLKDLKEYDLISTYRTLLNIQGLSRESGVRDTDNFRIRMYLLWLLEELNFRQVITLPRVD